MSLSPQRVASILGVAPSDIPAMQQTEDGTVTWSFPGVTLTAAQNALLRRITEAVQGTRKISEATLATWEATADADLTLKDEAIAEATDEADPVYQALVALSLLVLDEINTLRALHSLPERTRAQLKSAILNKLSEV